MNTNTKTTKNRMWTQVLRKCVNSSAPEGCELGCSGRVWTQVLLKDVNSSDPEGCELTCSGSVWTQVLRKCVNSGASEGYDLKCSGSVWTQVLLKGVNSSTPEGCELKCSGRVWLKCSGRIGSCTFFLPISCSKIYVYADVCMYSLFIFFGKILINTDLWKSIHYKFGLDFRDSVSLATPWISNNYVASSACSLFYPVYFPS